MTENEIIRLLEDYSTLNLDDLNEEEVKEYLKVTQKLFPYITTYIVRRMREGLAWGVYDEKITKETSKYISSPKLKIYAHSKVSVLWHIYPDALVNTNIPIIDRLSTSILWFSKLIKKPPKISTGQKKIYIDNPIIMSYPGILRQFPDITEDDIALLNTAVIVYNYSILLRLSGSLAIKSNQLIMAFVFLAYLLSPITAYATLTNSYAKLILKKANLANDVARVIYKLERLDINKAKIHKLAKLKLKLQRATYKMLKPIANIFGIGMLTPEKLKDDPESAIRFYHVARKIDNAIYKSLNNIDKELRNETIFVSTGSNREIL